MDAGCGVHVRQRTSASLRPLSLAAVRILRFVVPFVFRSHALELLKPKTTGLSVS